MRTKILIAILVVAASNTAQAKEKPQTPQTPPPPVAGSCKLDNGIWHGHCQVVPPIKIPKTPKMEKSK